MTSGAIRVGVNGGGGRMGSVACAAIAADPELELVAAVGSRTAGEIRSGVTIKPELRSFAEAECDVVVDFTVADAARVALPWLAMHGIHAVVGTSGLGEADIEELRHDFVQGGANCVISPNFAISAVLMMRFAEIAAPFFDTAEVIEYHHDRKIDAPAGTAIITADRIAAARGDVGWSPDPTQLEVLAGTRGGRSHGSSGVPVHAVRMRGMVAHQDVLFGTTGQTLTIRQDSYDRESFMPGVLLACKRIADHPGVTVGLDALLGI
jgi:4-hydroxy-tetrahydrodipicolinate reductase